MSIHNTIFETCAEAEGYKALISGLEYAVITNQMSLFQFKIDSYCKNHNITKEDLAARIFRGK